MNKPVKPPVQLAIRAAELEPYKDVKSLTLMPLNGKRPVHNNWPARNYDSAQVLATCQKERRNVGARLSDSWLVVDVDLRSGGAAGFADLCADFGLKPDEWPHVVTGSGGSHYYLRKPPGVKVMDTLEAYSGVEFKSGNGRQVVAAGSVHPDTGKHYEWEIGSPLLFDAPECSAKLLAAITRPIFDYAATGGGQYSAEQLVTALEAVDVTEFNSNDKWEPFMMAAHHATAGDGRQEWIDWSTSDPNYANDAEIIGRRWDSLHTSKPGGITVRTFNKILADHGAANAQIAADVGDDFEDAPPDVAEERKFTLNPTPYEWIDPAKIRQREWIYKPAYVGGYVSLTTAAGGAGKSALVKAEAAAIASGKPLLGIEPQRKRTWYWNGEDPADEIARGFAALRIHYDLKREDLNGWLFTDSGRDKPIKVATMKRGDFSIARPVVNAVIEAIHSNGIGVMIVDPFVTSHGVNENDNTMMNEVVDQWRKIADATGCAVHLVHHTRKTNGEAATIEASRGASAVSSAARVRRAVNPMTQADATRAGIPDPGRYISADYRSTSFIASGQAVAWHRFESVNLGNGPCGDGDEIGVLTACEIVGLNLRPGDEEAALDAIRAGGPWSKGAQSGEGWVGIPIAGACGLDAADSNHRKRLNAIIKAWLDSGVLQEIDGQRANRTPCKFIVAPQNNISADDFG